MKYEDFQLEDFLADEFFVKWVKNPDKESELFWKLWLSEHPDKRKLVGLAREIVLTTTYKNRRKPHNRDYSEVLENVLNPEKIHKQVSLDSKPKQAFWKIAAAISTLLMAAAFVYWQVSSAQPGQVPAKPQQQSVAMLTKQIPAGQKYTLKFEDGTKVKLNAMSTIRFPEHFSATERKVYLEGEAFFEVASDTARPFIVETASLSTEVLGTAFNVRAYNDEGKVEVALVEGKVKVKNEKSDDTILKPSEMAVFDRNQGQMATQRFNPAEITAWKEGVIYFRQASMEKIERVLEKWYGVEIILSGNTAIKGYNGEFSNESLENVLKGLSFSVGFDYQINGKQVRISMKN